MRNFIHFYAYFYIKKKLCLHFSKLVTETFSCSDDFSLYENYTSQNSLYSIACKKIVPAIAVLVCDNAFGTSQCNCHVDHSAPLS